MPWRPPVHIPLGLGTPGHRAPDSRPSAAVRGYDSRHRKYRVWWLARHPLCGDRIGPPAPDTCAARGIVAQAVVLSHIVPISQGGERFAPRNSESLCKPCHDRRTALDDGGFGRGR